MPDRTKTAKIRMGSRKSQIQMMETVMILVVFFIIVAIGFIFYSKIQESSIRELQRQRFEEEAVAISQNIIYMPELACSEKSVIIDICFDKYKLKAFAEVVRPQNRNEFLFYQKDFGESRITVREIFPNQKDAVVIYDNAPVISQETSSILTSVPVSLKDPAKRYGQYSIGILDIEVFA